MNKRNYLLGGVGALALIAGVVIVVGRLSAPKTPGEVVAKAVKCFNSKNTGCLMSLTNPEEKEALGLKGSTFRQAFAALNERFYKDWTPVGEPKVSAEPLNATVTQVYKSSDGYLFTQSFTAEQMGSKPYLVAVMPSLLLSPFVTQRTANEPVAIGERKLERWKEAGKFGKESLAPVGLPGLYIVGREGKASIRTWDEIINR